MSGILFERFPEAKRRCFAPWPLAVTVLLVWSAVVHGQEADAEGTRQVEPVYRGIPHDALYDMRITGDYGIAVGNYGLILESTDSGASWVKRESPMRVGLLGVDVSGDRRIIVGQQGTVLLGTADGGWQRVDSGTDSRLLNVAWNTDGLTVAVGEFGTVIRSRDYGATWEPITIDWAEYNDEGYEPHLYDALVTDDGEIVITGEFGLILWSVDGGDTWGARHRSDESVFAIQISSTGIGFAVGQDGFVVRTSDAGKTWERLEVPTGANLLGVWTGNGEVLVTGIREMLRSSDDGQTWTLSTDHSVTRNWYQAVAPGFVEVAAGNGFIRQQVVYVAGYEATISRVLY